MEEFLNLYHQKLWEIAFGNIVGTFFNFYTIVFVLLIYPYYILSDLLARRWETSFGNDLSSFYFVPSLYGCGVCPQL